MRLLESLETLFNDVSPVFSNVSLNVVEQPLLPDINLIGTVRFARRIGAIISALEPQNQMISSEIASQNTMNIAVETSIVWFNNWSVPGPNGRLLRSIIRIGNEFNYLDNLDSTNKIIYLMEGLLKEYERGTTIDLYGSPVAAELVVTETTGPSSSSGIEADNYTVKLTSRYPIMNNDIILLQWQSEVISFDEYQVILASLENTTIEDGQTIYRYYVTLTNELDFINKILHTEDAIPSDLYVPVFNSLLYIKAYPAFESRVVPLPFLANKVQVGLFCVDHMSGDLYAFDIPTSEFMNIKLRTNVGSYVHSYGTDETYKTIEKNTSIPNCISSDKIIIWNRINGHMTYDTAGIVRLIPDTNGETCIKCDINPMLNIPARWTCKFYTDIKEEATDPVQITVQLYPNAEMHYIIPYNSVGYEISIEAINNSISVLGIITDVSELPPIAEAGDTYILDGTIKGTVRFVGHVGFGGYWHTSTTNFGVIYFYNEKYYEFVRSDIDDIGHWAEVVSGKAIEKIIISTKSQYPIEMTSWTHKDHQVQEIEYQILGHVFGRNWMSSGLIVKPLMKTLFNLQGEYNDAKYNNGYIYSANRSGKKVGRKSWDQGTSIADIVTCG